MGSVGRATIAAALGRHYALQRAKPSDKDVAKLVEAMLLEDARNQALDGLSTPSFVAAQVRYIPAWTWFAQLTMVALMFAMAHGAAGPVATKLVVGILSAMTVLVGVPTINASAHYGMAELEYSCRHGFASILAARLIILGCSSSLAVALMIGAAVSSIDANAFAVALCACVPFFCTCAGSLAILRRVAPRSAPALCGVWAAACSIALLVLGSVFPLAYELASLAVWEGAAMLALAWLVHEVVLSLRAAALGLDSSLSPLAKTHE